MIRDMIGKAKKQAEVLNNRNGETEIFPPRISRKEVFSNDRVLHIHECRNGNSFSFSDPLLEDEFSSTLSYSEHGTQGSNLLISPFEKDCTLGRFFDVSYLDHNCLCGTNK